MQSRIRCANAYELKMGSGTAGIVCYLFQNIVFCLPLANKSKVKKIKNIWVKIVIHPMDIRRNVFTVV